MSKKQKFYTTEFKAEAIKGIDSNKGNVSGTARHLGISMQTLSHWYGFVAQRFKIKVHLSYLNLRYNSGMRSS